MQAFIASERRDFATALMILKYIEQVAPVSAGTAAETGYVYNQLGKPAEGLSAYRRAHALSVKYASQRPYRAAALRGIGFALIELKQLDEAEKTFRESLEIEPGNKVALSELAYISNLRGAK
jgi:Flp pilus assembly protein TadD